MGGRREKESQEIKRSRDQRGKKRTSVGLYVEELLGKGSPAQSLGWRRLRLGIGYASQEDPIAGWD